MLLVYRQVQWPRSCRYFHAEGAADPNLSVVDCLQAARSLQLGGLHSSSSLQFILMPTKLKPFYLATAFQAIDMQLLLTGTEHGHH